jgi:hypothetical protein
MPENLTPAQARIVVDLLRRVFQDIVSPLRLELAAHAAMLLPLKAIDSDIVDAALNSVRENPALRESMHQQYLEALEKPFQQFLEHVQDVESLEHLFQGLKHTDLN